MKSYTAFCEAISPARLAQLKAKGKGPAAAAKMKADGLSVAPHQGTKEKSRRVQQGSAGQNLGGSITKKSPTIKRPVKPQSRPNKSSAISNIVMPVAKSAARAAAEKGASIIRTKRGGTGKEAIGATKSEAPRGDGTKSYDRVDPRNKGTLAKGGKKRKITYGDRVGHAGDRQFAKRSQTLKDKFKAHNVGKNIANTIYDAPKNIAKTAIAGGRNAIRGRRSEVKDGGKVDKLRSSNSIQ